MHPPRARSPPARLLPCQLLRFACLQLGPFLETVPCHYLSPSKFQFVALIPSNPIQYQPVSWMPQLSSPYTQHNFPTTLFETNYSQAHFSPPGRQPSGDTQGPPMQVFANSVQGHTARGPQASTCRFARNCLSALPELCGSRGASGGVCEATAAREVETREEQTAWRGPRAGAHSPKSAKSKATPRGPYAPSSSVQ